MLKRKIIKALKEDYQTENNLQVIYQILGGDVLEGRRHKTDCKYSVLNLNGEYTILFDSPIDLAIYVNRSKYTEIKTWYFVQHDNGSFETVEYLRPGDKIISVMEGEKEND